jgi:hypothetical protein
MKNLFFGVIATVMFSFSGFAATNIEKDKTKPATTVAVTVTKTEASKKLQEESCTVCITISIAGSGGSQCATAATCSRARTLVAS